MGATYSIVDWRVCRLLFVLVATSYHHNHYDYQHHHEVERNKYQLCLLPRIVIQSNLIELSKRWWY